MRKTNKKIALIGIILLLTATLGILVVSNKTLKKDIKNEKIKSEALLSEKLALDKSIAKFRSELNAMQGKNSVLDKKLAEMNQKLSKKESELRKVIAENNSLQKLKIKNAELDELKNKLNAELTGLMQKYDNLKLENSKITKELAEVNIKKEQIIVNNTILKALAGNNYRIEAVRGKKDKLTVNAKRTQKLLVNFDLPNDVVNDINFKLITPDGKELESKGNSTASINILDNNDHFLASINEGSNVGTKNVELVYKPNEKLVKGIYKFDVYNNGTYIGSTQLRLQ